ncbi:MAG: HAMP domain-containing protein, partial [Candidatus Hydrogenedentota bacterium]
MKIRTRLFILLVALTLIPIVILGIGAYLVAGGAIEGKVAEQLYKVRAELTRSGADVVGAMNRTLDEMEQDRNFELCLRYASSRDVSLLRDIIEKTFLFHVSRDPWIIGTVAEIPGAEAIRVIRPGISLPAIPTSPGIRAIEGGHFCASREVTRGGARGMIHLFFSQDAFLPMLRDANIGAGKPVAGFLVANGKILTPYPDDNQSLLQSDLDGDGLISYGDRVAVAGKIEGTDLVIGASLSDAAFRDPLSRVRNLTLLLIMAGFAAAGAAALVFATTLVRPIQSMVEVTRRVADGDLDVSLTSERADELGELATDFNRMTVKLKESEARVEERTRALVQEQARVGLALRMCRNVLLERGFESEVQAVCEEIRKHFGFSRVSVYLVSETGLPGNGARIEGAAAPELPVRAAPPCG